jgi:hypothetical protein
MFTYQIRKRILRIDSSKRLHFPSEGEISFHLTPKQPFGEEKGGGRTAVRNVKATMKFDANSGLHSIESRKPLRRLNLKIKLMDGELRVLGNKLTLSCSFQSRQDLIRSIESYYHVAPMLLSIDFGDPPIIERVDGRVGDVSFRWELEHWNARFTITTRARQHSAIVACFDRMKALSRPGSHRVLAALHYFHVALRLSRRGQIAGEFLAEMILNLSKSLEVLFPPSGSGKSRDAVRRGLKSLGFAEGEIERDFLPCMALRNEIDVAHVDLSIYKLEQLTVIHNYVERCEFAFRGLFKKLLKQLEGGTYSVPRYTPTPPSSATVRIIDKLRDSMRELASETEGAPVETQPLRKRSRFRWRARWRAIRLRSTMNLA